MLRIILILLPIVATVAACSGKKDSNKAELYNPDKYLTTDQQHDVIAKTIRYSTKLAPEATHETKFDGEFDWYYDKAIAEYDLMAYYIDKDSTNFFFMTRKARSMKPLREGIAGKIKIAKDGTLSEYEEVFRTWKMPEDTLKKRGIFLFERLIDGRDLSLYYSKFQRDRYIEFPDDRFFFNKETRSWRDRELDSLAVRDSL